jgi:hypothetical protein
MAARGGTAHANMIHTFFPITLSNSESGIGSGFRVRSSGFRFGFRGSEF